MIRSLLAARPGQNMVEFAFIFGVLMMLTMGTVDFAQAAWEFNTVAYLAREGARYGIVPSHKITESDPTRPLGIKEYAVARAALPGLTTGNVFVDDRGTCGDVTDPVIVRVRYTYQPSSPLVAVLVGSSVILESSARMYVESGVAGVDCACGGTCT